MKQFSAILLVCLCSLTSCFFDTEITNPYSDQTVEGQKPLYAVFDNEHYYSTSPEPITALENIVLYKNYILVVEQLAGIHVISNTDPGNPVQVAFWVLPGVTNFTIANDVLYMALGRDIVAIQIIDINNLNFISTLDNAIKSYTSSRSPDLDGPFECVHPDSGVVLSWYFDELVDPNCWK